MDAAPAARETGTLGPSIDVFAECGPDFAHALRSTIRPIVSTTSMHTEAAGMRFDLLEHHGNLVSARLTGRVSGVPIHFRAPGVGDGAVSDALLAAALLPAMCEGGTLQLPGPLSPRLLDATSAIQEVLLTWDRLDWRSGLRPVHVEAGSMLPEPASGDGVGCFFTAGVDSFYSALRHRDEITHLVFVHGFDVPLTKTNLRHRVAAAVNAAGAEMGKEVIEVEADVRSFSDPIVDWTRYHGSLLACVGHLLTPYLRKIFVPASDTYATLSPFGSHPLLDELWASERLMFAHDGCEATRADKVAFLSDHQLALRWLRVCPKNPNNTYNCGKCHKCLRTMAVLRMEGLLDRCETLGSDIDLKAFARLGPPSSGSRLLWEGYHRRIRYENNDRALARAVRSYLGPWRQHVAIERTRLKNLRDRLRARTSRGLRKRRGGS
jgi:hypothetical protein